MKSAVTIFLLLNSMFSIADTSKTKGWRGIVPLHSTRTDVERLLGPGTNECKCAYYLDDLNVFFNYSPGDCKSGRGAWDVPVDTVVWITVHPKSRPQLSDLSIDESKFEKRPGGHIEDLIYYVNEEEGLTLLVSEGIVQTFLYGPTAKDKHLRCQ